MEQHGQRRCRVTSPGGLVTAIASSGSSTIRAAQGGLSGSAVVQTSVASLVSLVVTPVGPTLADGTSLQMHATGAFSDGSTQDLTGTALWSTGNGSFATISSPGGVLTAAAAGITTVRATSGAVQATVPVTVTNAGLLNVVVTPQNSSLAQGTAEQLTATEFSPTGPPRTLPHWLRGAAAAWRA